MEGLLCIFIPFIITEAGQNKKIQESEREKEKKRETEREREREREKEREKEEIDR